MSRMEEALGAIESLDDGEHFTYTKIADTYGVHRVTLSRRHKQIQASRTDQAIKQQLLSPRQELELVKYITRLTEQGLPPTREMIRSFATTIYKGEVGEGWVTRFINRNHDSLTAKWTSGMDRDRHEADSEWKYNRYFDLLHAKMEQYDILPENTYNMDEKGFMIGKIGRSKRIFNRQIWERKQVKDSLQDGSREWVSVLACIGADGTALPPGIIFEAENGNIRSTWVEDMNEEHQVFVGSSPSGWSNDDLGFAWLTQVFDRYTKAKAGRAWRLLILDGHGSHLTMKFIKFCTNNRILLMIYPSHSTHTLQPLDVVMFKPLSSSYSAKLVIRLHKSMGILPIKKGDFIPLFWSAWISSFKKETILSSFQATGIWPKQREVILKRFHQKTSNDEDKDSTSDTLSDANWRKIREVVQSSVKDGASKEVQRVIHAVHHLQVQNELLLSENSGLRESLATKKKRNKKGKTLDLQQEGEYHGGAVVWSPRKLREAEERQVVREKAEEQEKLQKAEMKELRASNVLFKKKLAEEKRVEKKRLKKEREKEKEKKAEEAAKKKQQKEQEKQAANLSKSLQQPQKGKRAASKQLVQKNKRVKRCSGGASGVSSEEPPSLPPPKITTRGRSITIPKKFR